MDMFNDDLNDALHIDERMLGIVAVDDGFARTKVCTLRNGYDMLRGTAVPRVREFGTVIASGSTGLVNFSGGVSNAWEADGQTFSVSDRIAGDSTTFEGFHWSPMNRVLINHYLAVCGYSDKDVEVLQVGLPINLFYDNDGSLSRNIEKKINNLRQPVTPLGNTLRPPRSIKKIEVIAQGMVAYLDLTMGWNLRQIVEGAGRVVVIDIGGRTTDIASVVGSATGGTRFDRKTSGSLDIGVLEVHKLVNTKIRSEFNLNVDLTSSQLDDLISSGNLRVRGVVQDVTQVIEGAIDQVQGRLVREIHAAVPGIDLADKVMLVGGGANLFTGLTTIFPGSIVTDTPQWSNVRGMWKFSCITLDRA